MKTMTTETKKMIINEIYNGLDFWCEQYKIANENKRRRWLDAFNASNSIAYADEAVMHDYETERISANIRSLENALNNMRNYICGRY